MKVVEKNDVDINKLFAWGTKYEVVDANEEVQATIYMRLLGDADVNRARVYALRKSAEMRKTLKDKDSVERSIYVKDPDEMTKESLINYIAVFSMREINNKAYKEVKVDRPKMPKSDAPLEKMEKYQAEIDAYPEKLAKAVETYIKKEVDKLKEYLEKESQEELYKRYVEMLIDEFCEQEAFKAYKDMELYLGCYKDEGYREKFFESFEQFDNLDSTVKADFRAAYETINVKMEDLKKLRQATQ